MSELYSNSIFWIDSSKIRPNPYQPRREFDEAKLRDLADSIRQYGILQPLVVSRIEVETPDGLSTEYELIAGERRLRASQLANVGQVPVIIRVGDDSLTKLELAIIENLQREDLNAVERARAFLRFIEEFKYTHNEIGKKVGKSREYVSNTMRLLSLPQDILDALSQGKIQEGHTRPLLMLSDRPEEQLVLFKEIVFKKISVREAERIARRIAIERARKKEELPDPKMAALESELSNVLGTRVHIEKKTVGGQITIDFLSEEDLEQLHTLLGKQEPRGIGAMVNEYAAGTEDAIKSIVEEARAEEARAEEALEGTLDFKEEDKPSESEDEDIYNIKNFTL